MGQALIVVAAILWSSSGFFAKSPFFDWAPEDRGPLLAFWRAVFASVVLATMVRRPRLSWRFLPMTLLFVAMNYTFLTAMVRTEASVVIWLQHLAPAWVLLGGTLLFREPITRNDLILLAFAATGVGVILFNQVQGQDPWAITLGLASGVTYAGVVLSLRQLRDEDPAWLITLNHLVTAIAFLPFALTRGSLPQGSQWLILAAFGVLQMGLPYVLFAMGVRRISSTQASGLMLLEPILLPIWVFVAWGHRPDYVPPQISTWIGASLILVGLAIRFLGQAARTSDSSLPAISSDTNSRATPASSSTTSSDRQDTSCPTLPPNDSTT